MFLQTLVQLHILLAATPALAGWTLLMPCGQSLPAHVIYLVSQSAGGETTSASVVSRHVMALRRTAERPMLRRPLKAQAEARETQNVSYAVVAAATPLNSFLPLPHAARAP